MKIFSASELRNVAVVGHNTVGKTTLVAALLHSAGATTRPGRIDEGTCPTDFDGEEMERQISINLSVAHAMHRDVRVNFLDAPGYGIFSPEAHAAVAAADAVLIVLDAVSGVEVQTDKVWKFAAELGRPVIFVVNRMDRERASFDRTMETLRRKYGRAVVPRAELPQREAQVLERIVAAPVFMAGIAGITMVTLTCASAIGLPTLRVSSRATSSTRSASELAMRRMILARSVGVTARHAGNAAFARATAASASSTPACGSSASTSSVAGSTTFSMAAVLVATRNGMK